MYFISFATVHWIDVFTRNEYKDELIKCWQYCQEKKGLEIYAWCIMPSHVHMLIGSHDKLMEDIVRDMKSYTSTQLRKLIKEHPQESRREWMQWMFERAGKRTAITATGNFGNNIINLLKFLTSKCMQTRFGIFIKILL